MNVFVQALGPMQELYALLAGLCLLQTCAVSAQSTSPDSGLYIPLKFDLGIGNAVKISTVEGNNTDYIAQTLDVQEGQFSPGISAENKGFVQTKGSQFTLNGEPWYCAGTNAYYAGLKWIMSDNEVSVMMKVSYTVLFPFSSSRIFYSPATPSFYLFRSMLSEVQLSSVFLLLAILTLFLTQ
jgi:hypothetical protein